MNTDEYWKIKLLAYLHDPPCKALDIKTHEMRAESFRKSAGIEDDILSLFERKSDWMASSVDRFPFPQFRKSGLKADFNGTERNPFRHPFGGDSLDFSIPLDTATLAEDYFAQSINVVPGDTDWSPFAKFMLYWRRWPEESARKDERLAYLPADTRIPDHTIWNHMGMTSAFQSCVDSSGELKPSFFMFSIGPVQEFISAARSTRDFFSGSYLLSWLAAHALKVIAEELGPDHVIFPNLRGQPIFDALFRESVYQKISIGRNETLWDRMGYSPEQLLTPTLPNVFLAVVPEHLAGEIGEKTEKAVRTELKNISEHSWDAFEKIAVNHGFAPEPGWKKRWEEQTSQFLRVYWQSSPWNDSLEDDENLSQLRKFAVEIGAGENTLISKGFTWPLQYRESARLMAARKNLRDFEPFVTDENQEGSPKDVLTGKEEIIGSEELWDALKSSGDENDENRDTVFKMNEGPYGAVSLIKRLWMRDDQVSYLRHRLKLSSLNLKIPSIPEIAGKNILKSGYVAVLSLDGDEMGKWISGEKLPPFLDQLAPEVKEWMKSKGVLSSFPEKTRRALFPSYHLQFSEALSNFSNHIVREVVEGFGGYLIYSGGDDVLAVLPADRALSCAYYLRSCFRGESPELFKRSNIAAGDSLIESVKNISNYRSLRGWMIREDWSNEKYPLMMPGPEADVSCGIVIAHEKYPLTSMIKEAHKAEKRAKNYYGRGAFSLSLLKRGGETIHWGSKWQSGGFYPLELYLKFLELRQESGGRSALSGRFTSALMELLYPYRLETGDFSGSLDVKSLILKELEHVILRQSDPDLMKGDTRESFMELSSQYLDLLDQGYSHLSGEKNLSGFGDFINLFRTATFNQRERD